MNFLQFCLATKNYSAIDAVRCYAKNKSNVGKYIAGGGIGAAVAGIPLGIGLMNQSKAKKQAESDRDSAINEKLAAEEKLNDTINESRAMRDLAQEHINKLELENDTLKKESQDLHRLHNELTRTPAFKTFPDKYQAKRWIESQQEKGNDRAIDYKIYRNTTNDGDPMNDYQVVDESQFYQER